MARGRRRPSLRRRTHPTSKCPLHAGNANGGRARHLAVNALACTGAVISALTPARAITLGEATVHSTLGQPLSATVPVQLAPGEYLGGACVTAPRSGGTDLQPLPGPRILAPETAVVGTHNIRVTTTRPLYEPMYELQLQIKCPGTALLVRQYVLMLDLPGAISEASAPAATLPAAIRADAAPMVVATPATPARQPVASRAARPRPLASFSDPIPAGSRYTVRRGDTLSTIAARVQHRSGSSLWQFADHIFAANPAAFIGANPDLIRLGVEIDIPPATSSSATAASEPATVPAQTAVVAAPVAVYEDTPLPVAEPTTTVAQTVPEVTLGTPDISGNRPAQSLPQTVSAVPGAGEPAAGHELSPEVPVAEPAESPASPLLAAGLGILVGLGLSFVLLRERLMEALRDIRRRRAARGRPVPAATHGVVSATVSAAAPAPRVSRTAPPRDSSMVVVEEAREEPGENPAIPEPTARTPALAPQGQLPAQAASLDADLDRLFDDDVSPFPADSFDPTDATLAAAGSDQALDLDLTGAVTDEEQAADIAWVGDETRLAQTQKAVATDDTVEENTAEQLDLQALASSADTDEKLSRTLMEALTLLERDYEDELTASQVLDLNKLRDDAAEDDGTTLARTGTGPRKRR